MTAYAYYPGCTLHGTAIEYGLSTQAVCRALGVELRELDDWNCCGASSAHAVNPWLAHGLVARNMRLAGATGLDALAIPCAACFARFKATQQALQDPETAAGIEEVAGGPVPRDLEVAPLLAVLTEPGLLGKLEAAVVRPLAGLEIAPYYGCLLTRPAEVAGFDDPEDPQSLDRLLRTLGAHVVTWPGKTACCGSSLALSRTEVVLDLSHRLIAWAEEAGANAIATACPMCHSNLDMRQAQMRRAGLGKHAMPVYYFTELVGVALGIGHAELGLSRHVVDVRSLVERVPAGARS
ncbi:MAG TPA: CoB--CoM heterodisulfide reductase iron-sulfur subunit B family protein [Vicinamibacteria bacterium]|nr:CoB--CoM heterodisulfide reductase iron-sulfur subunit B family protein [Vicinamibacteria bacterium]